VFREPLIEAGDTLWLEHVLDKSAREPPCYWLMWYDASGIPAIPMSSVLSRDDIANMGRLLASFLP